MIQAVARAVGENFPELGGRSIAVSEVDPFDQQTNYPNLPIAVTALVNEQALQGRHGGGQIKLSSDILIEFIFLPVKYTTAEGKESPFFAFYDYESIRDRLLRLMKHWRTPRNGSISYKSLVVDSDEYAVHLVFRFMVEEIWCDVGHSEEPSLPARVSFSILQPRGEAPCCEPCEEPPDETRKHGDPC